jgi:hypothetical protein
VERDIDDGLVDEVIVAEANIRLAANARDVVHFDALCFALHRTPQSSARRMHSSALREKLLPARPMVNRQRPLLDDPSGTFDE